METNIFNANKKKLKTKNKPQLELKLICIPLQNGFVISNLWNTKAKETSIKFKGSMKMV